MLPVFFNQPSNSLLRIFDCVNTAHVSPSNRNYARGLPLLRDAGDAIGGQRFQTGLIQQRADVGLAAAAWLARASELRGGLECLKVLAQDPCHCSRGSEDGRSDLHSRGWTAVDQIKQFRGDSVRRNIVTVVKM